MAAVSPVTSPSGAAATAASPAASPLASPLPTPTLPTRSTRADSTDGSGDALYAAAAGMLSPQTTKARLQQRLAAVVARHQHPPPPLPPTPSFALRSLGAARDSPVLSPLSMTRPLRAASQGQGQGVPPSLSLSSGGNNSRSSAASASAASASTTSSSSSSGDDIPAYARIDDDALLAHVLRHRVGAEAADGSSAAAALSSLDSYSPLPPDELRKLENLPLRVRLHRSASIVCPTGEKWVELLTTGVLLFVGLMLLFGLSNALFFPARL